MPVSVCFRVKVLFSPCPSSDLRIAARCTVQGSGTASARFWSRGLESSSLWGSHGTAEARRASVGSVRIRRQGPSPWYFGLSDVTPVQAAVLACCMFSDRLRLSWMLAESRSQASFHAGLSWLQSVGHESGVLGDGRTAASLIPWAQHVSQPPGRPDASVLVSNAPDRHGCPA